MKRPLLLILLGLVLLSACGGDANSDTDTTDQVAKATLAPAESLPAWTDELLSEPLDLSDDANIALTTTDGEPFVLSDQTNTITVLYFGFTSCPDVCPLTMHDLGRAYFSLNMPSDKLQVALVTIDPDRDTPELLGAYVERYNADFIGLTGTPDALQEAYDTFGVRAEKVELADSALGYTMDHSADVYIIPPDRAYARRFQHGATFSNFAHDLSMLMDHLGDMDGPQTVPYADELFGIAQDRTAPLSDFTLTNAATGDAFTLSEQRGKITVLYYGFTSCPDICPLTLFELSRAMETLGDDATHVQVIMVTVDPERDTPDLLKNYVQRYDPRFIGLYGDLEATETAKAVFGVLAFKQELLDSALGYTIDHTADMFVLGPNGDYLLRIQHGTPYVRLAADLQKLIDNELPESE